MKAFAIFWMVALLLISASASPAQSVVLKSLTKGERPFYKDGKMVIRTLRRQTWMGDSATLMRPYTLLDQGVADWDRMLGLELSQSALAEIDFAARAHLQRKVVDQKKFELRRPWSGKPLMAYGGAIRAVGCVPVYQNRLLRGSDSTYLPGIDPELDAQSGRIQAFRKIKFDGMRGLLVMYDELCHADRQYTYSNYLLYRPDGLLHSVVMLQAPCPESRDFAYLVYEWDEASYLKRIKIWSMSESKFAGETTIEVSVYEW